MKTNKILMIACFLMGLIGSSGCKDDDFTEITTLDVPRAFSPTELQAIVVNRVEVRLNWRAVSNADSYKIEVFENAEYSGAAFKTVENVTFDKLPYTVPGLAGETPYWVRVKAIGEGVDDSKWITATFTTDAEQIFENVNLQVLTSTTVTLNWPAGATTTSVSLSPGNIVHTLTSDEIAAGEVTIEGLAPETDYTAKLINGPKTRGTRTFTTLMDLSKVTTVSPGDDLATIVANANPGATIALFPGAYDIKTEVLVNKTLTIRGTNPANKPVVKGAIFKINGLAGFTLRDLVLDGTGEPNGNQTIIYNQDNTTGIYEPLLVQDCEITKYVKGVLYGSVKARITSVTIRGNIISEIKGTNDIFDFRNSIADTFLFENNTVYNTTDPQRDFFRMDSGGSTAFSGVKSIITIRANTFYNVINTAGGRMLYIRLASHEIHFTKNIIAKSTGYYSKESPTITTMADNNYFEAPNYTESATAGATNDKGTFTKKDPKFASPSTGNFTISDIDLKAKGVGDPRWRE